MVQHALRCDSPGRRARLPWIWLSRVLSLPTGQVALHKDGPRPRGGGLLEGRCAGCGKVTLVPNNLNTHTEGALCGAFEPERARALLRRIKFRYAPRDGSWLNVTELELSAMTRQ